jgi:hypothetical protein
VLVPNATEASAAGGSGETDESNTTTAGGGNTSGSGNASGGSGGANVTTVTLREEFNASVLARQDPAVEDSILTAPNGTRYVRYASNGTTQPVEEFLPEPHLLEQDPTVPDWPLQRLPDVREILGPGDGLTDGGGGDAVRNRKAEIR